MDVTTLRFVVYAKHGCQNIFKSPFNNLTSMDVTILRRTSLINIDEITILNQPSLFQQALM